MSTTNIQKAILALAVAVSAMRALPEAPRVLYWTGASGTNEWRRAENWSTATGVATEAPGPSDDVVFTEEASVVITKDAYAHSITNYAKLTLQGQATLSVKEVSGGGSSAARIVADGPTFCSVSGYPLDFYEHVHFPAGASATFLTVSDYCGVEFRGGVSGAGTIVSDQRYAKYRSHCAFYGDCSGFAGEYSEINVNGDIRDFTTFWSASSASPNAVYSVIGNGGKANTLLEGGATYRFGAYRGRIYRCNNDIRDVVIEIGARDDEESWIDGNVWGGNFSIEKVGTNVLQVFGGYFESVKIKEGKVRLRENGIPYSLVFAGGSLACEDGLDPSSVITNSTFPIIFDDEGLYARWSSPLASSNTGGLVKRGAGTLVLEKMPLIQGEIVVEEGTLVLPAETWNDSAFQSRIRKSRNARVRYGELIDADEVALVPYTMSEWDASGDGVTWDYSGSNWSGLGAGELCWIAPQSYSNGALITRDASIATPAETDIEVRRVKINSTNVSLVPGRDATISIVDELQIVAASGATNTITLGSGIIGTHALYMSNSTVVVANSDLGLNKMSENGRLDSSYLQTFTVDEGEETFTGELSGSMTIVKKGEGRLNLQCACGYSGVTAVDEGVLSTLGLPYWTSLNVAEGATIDLCGRTPDYDQYGNRYHIIQNAYIAGTVTNGMFRVQRFITFAPGSVMYVDPSIVKKGNHLMWIGKAGYGIENLELRMTDGSEMDPTLKLGDVNGQAIFVDKPRYAILAADGTESLWADYVANIQSLRKCYYCIITNTSYSATAEDVVFDATMFSTPDSVRAYLGKVAAVRDPGRDGRYARGMSGFNLAGYEREFLGSYFASEPVGRVDTDTAVVKLRNYATIVDMSGDIAGYSGLCGEIFTNSTDMNALRALYLSSVSGAVRISDLEGNVLIGDSLLDVHSWTVDELTMQVPVSSELEQDAATVRGMAEGNVELSGSGETVFKIREGFSVSGTNVVVGIGLTGGFGGEGVVFEGESGCLTFGNNRPFYVTGLSNVRRIEMCGNRAVLDWSGIDTSALETIVLAGFNTMYYNGSAMSPLSFKAKLLEYCEFSTVDACLELVDETGVHGKSYLTKPGLEAAVGSFSIEGPMGGELFEFRNSSLTAASSLLSSGATVSLDSDVGFAAPMRIPASGVTIDLGGHSITNCSGSARWMFDVGTNEVRIANGTIDAGRGYGIYVTEGRVRLDNVKVVSRGRAVQIAGYGRLDECDKSSLVNTGNDPALMIVGGYGGRAEAHLRGVVSNTCASVKSGVEDYRWAISGHDDDLAGAEIYIYDTASVGSLRDGGTEDEGSIYFPEEGGDTHARVEHPETGNTLDVPKRWLLDKGFRVTEHARKGANGIAAWESYALGLDPTDKDSLPNLKVHVTDKRKFIVEMDGLEPVEGVTPVCNLLELGKDFKSETDRGNFDGKAELDIENGDNSAHCFRVRVKIRF